MTEGKEKKQNKGQEYAESVAIELIKQLEAGTAPWQKPWEPAQGLDLPYNHTTGNEYSGLNELVLMMQRRADPRWMTYKQAQSIGAQVRKGEKGVGLMRVITHAETIKRDENNKPVLDADGNTVKIYIPLDKPLIKSFTVFNGEQIEGIPPHEIKIAQYDWEPIEKAEQILKASQAKIEISPFNHPAYRPASDTITLPEKRQIPNQEFYYSTALHELGHWTGHPSRLDRDLSGRFGSADYAKEELKAEIASMMLSRELGLPHNPEQHAAYVGSWIQALKDDPMEIFHASKDAQSITEYIKSFTREQEIQKDKDVGTLKQEYHQQSTLLTPKEREHRQSLVAVMEKVISGLPDTAKEQAQLNFYQNQIQDKQHTRSASTDMDIER